MIRVCAFAMRLIARALEMNVASSDPADLAVLTPELAEGFSAVFGGLSVRPVMLYSLDCVSSWRL